MLFRHAFFWFLWNSATSMITVFVVIMSTMSTFMIYMKCRVHETLFVSLNYLRVLLSGYFLLWLYPWGFFFIGYNLLLWYFSRGLSFIFRVPAAMVFFLTVEFYFQGTCCSCIPSESVVLLWGYPLLRYFSSGLSFIVRVPVVWYSSSVLSFIFRIPSAPVFLLRVEFYFQDLVTLCSGISPQGWVLFSGYPLLWYFFSGLSSIFRVPAAPLFLVREGSHVPAADLATREADLHHVLRPHCVMAADRDWRCHAFYHSGSVNPGEKPWEILNTVLYRNINGNEHWNCSA
jgi:hypothetical protein